MTRQGQRARFGVAAFGAPATGDPYEIFISSSNECVVGRRLCCRVIHHVVNPSLASQAGGPIFVPVLWKDALPQRIDEVESVNDFFVLIALECHATVVLVESTLGAGRATRSWRSFSGRRASASPSRSLHSDRVAVGPARR